MSVLVQTSLGNIVIDLYTKIAPLESKNFLKLCKAKYFTFAPIFNVQRDYVLEMGDPLYPISKEGSSAWNLADGSKSKYIQSKKNKLHQNKKGTVSFVGQPDPADRERLYISSLFTITLKDLDEKRTSLQNNVVFGQVVEGLDVLDLINEAIVDEKYVPLRDIRVHHMIILDDPFDDIDGLLIPLRTPEPTKEQLSTIRLDDIEELKIDETLSEEDDKLAKQREANSKALTLELIGDLPSAEVKPMENVLFVCKLNPLTRDEDLEIIFSRFGKIISCEIIRDGTTGDSLQYAFIEYEEKKSCENAYFKMDGALIDDRRIHVDFSQSVSRLADVWRSNANRQRKGILNNGEARGSGGTRRPISMKIPPGPRGFKRQRT